jgi:hypothetical protein
VFSHLNTKNAILLTVKKTNPMEINFLALLVAAVTTLLVGFVWYHPKSF